MKLINLTPHDVLVFREGAVIAHFPSQGLARVTQESRAVGRITLDGTTVAIPITAARYGPVEGLPALELDTAYIVDAQVASALPGRGSLLVPDDLVRDERGKVIGCQALRSLCRRFANVLAQRHGGSQRDDQERRDGIPVSGFGEELRGKTAALEGCVPAERAASAPLPKRPS